jgi:hypothetical protein
MHTAHRASMTSAFCFGDVEVTVELRGANRVIHVVWKTGVNIVPSPVTCSAVITQTVRAPITWGGSKHRFRYVCAVGRDQPMDDRLDATPRLCDWAGERGVELPVVCVEAAVW